MPIVRAAPNQFLLTGRGGRLENRGSAVQLLLRPGTVWVLVPSGKQEATFEFTQETKDGIPLRFKGSVIYRVTDPVAAARLFDFGHGAGISQVSTLLTHVCLGELRHAVSHMTMAECIEQRKTVLSGVAEAALLETIRGGEGQDWGITVEVAQLAQVFIVDAELRAQLEAEIRNEIRLKSDQSDVRTREETRLAEIASDIRVKEQQLAADREAVRRDEALEQANVARQRRTQSETLETDRQALALEQQRVEAQQAADRARVEAEAPVRLLRIAKETEILREELVLRELQGRVRASDVELELALPRATQAMRLELLPVEQAPAIVKAASGVLHGTNLSIYGEESALIGQLAPVLEVVGRAVSGAVAATAPRAPHAAPPEPSA